MPSKLFKKRTMDDFAVETWFERDRAHVALVDKRTGKAVIQWWDEEVAEVIEDGFLDPRNFLRSAYKYAKSIRIIK